MLHVKQIDLKARLFLDLSLVIVAKIPTSDEEGLASHVIFLKMVYQYRFGKATLHDQRSLNVPSSSARQVATSLEAKRWIGSDKVWILGEKTENGCDEGLLEMTFVCWQQSFQKQCVQGTGVERVRRLIHLH